MFSIFEITKISPDLSLWAKINFPCFDQNKLQQIDMREKMENSRRYGLEVHRERLHITQ